MPGRPASEPGAAFFAVQRSAPLFPPSLAGEGEVGAKMTSPGAMELRLYDTLTREKPPFEPLDPQRVRMYVCGPTVYDFAHIGNARPVIVFDVLFRLLRHLYGADHVTYVRNVTDVDDKINARAAEEYPDRPLNEAIRAVTEKTERQFHEDVAALGCLPPTVEPRATEHIAEMKALIERLVAGGNAYVADDHVLFSVPSMPDYGALSKRPLDEMIAGARIEVAPYKRDPMDFVLWKPSKPGEPAWPSPAGIKTPGRPGWHIECSAMAWRHLGETFDIHGGGIDLVFPHHENEIAQSRCAFHSPLMAKVWMHNGFLQVEGAKMAKSEGNFVTIRELLDTEKFGGRRWFGDVLRLAMLRTHYRQPIDWTVKALEEAESALMRFSDVHPVVDAMNERPELFTEPPLPGRGPSRELLSCLIDDLNLPAAIAYLHTLRQRSQSAEGNVAKTDAAFQLWHDAKFLGFDLGGFRKRTNERRQVDALQYARVSTLVIARNAARARKDFKEADRIRDELAAMGVVLKDSKDGTTWEIAR
jgi:cysteinyl-tRNA synthetase